jgi:F-type H+-transporting ATPase subunit epsilon
VNTFVLHLQSAMRYERADDVVSFVAQDSSGKFGILAGHARMLACLDFGLARFRTLAGGWEYLALPGGVLYFVDNQLHLSTRRYLRDTDYERISAALQEQLRAEEEALSGLKESLRQMEQQMLKRLWELGRRGEHML